MKKKYAFVMVFLFAVFLLSSCSVKYDTHIIRLSHKRYPAEVLSLPEEDVEKLLEILNSDDWEKNTTMTACYCLFSIDGINLEYSYESGLFQDEDNNRTLFLDDTQKAYVNSLADNLYGIKRENLVPFKLDEVYEISDDNIVYSTEKTVGETISVNFNETEYGLKYESTILYSVDGIKVHRYTVVSDNDAIVLFNEDGSLFAFSSAEFGKIRVNERNEADILEDMRTSFGKLIDISGYESVKVEGPITDTLSAFDSYKVILRNEIQGYVTDCLTMYVTPDGTVTDLRNSVKCIAKDDVSVTIDKMLVDTFIEFKLDHLYNTKETELRNYFVVSAPELKIYKDEICAACTLECQVYDKNNDKEFMSDWKIYIPVRLVAAE